MAESHSKENQEALIRDLDEQYKICKCFFACLFLYIVIQASLLTLNSIRSGIFVCLKCLIKNMSLSVCDLWLFLYSSLLLNVNIARLNLILIHKY